MKWSRRLLVLLAIASLLFPHWHHPSRIVEAAATGNAYAEETTDQLFTGDTDWHDIVTIAVASTTAASTYLLFARTQLGSNQVTNDIQARVIHGTSTVFAGSDNSLEPVSTSFRKRQNYSFMTRFTQATPAEALIVQARLTNSADELNVATTVLLVVEVDTDDLAEGTDYFFSATSTNTSLTTTFVPFASLSFTPDNDGDDWLVVASSRHDISDAANQVEARINFDSGASTTPMWSEEGEDATNELKVYTLSRTYNLDNTAHTFQLEARKDVGTGDNITHSQIVALRLNTFEDHDSGFDDTFSPSGQDSVEELQGLASYTPQTAGENVIISSASNDGGSEAIIRVQVNGATTPVQDPTDEACDGSNCTEDTDLFDATDENSMFEIVRVNMDTSAQDIDQDASSGGPGGLPIDYGSITVFSLELAAAAPPPPAERRRPTLITEGSLRHWQLAA